MILKKDKPEIGKESKSSSPTNSKPSPVDSSSPPQLSLSTSDPFTRKQPALILTQEWYDTVSEMIGCNK